MSVTFVSYNYHGDLSPTWIAGDMHEDKKSLQLLLEMFSNNKKSSKSFFVLFFKIFDYTVCISSRSHCTYSMNIQ